MDEVVPFIGDQYHSQKDSFSLTEQKRLSVSSVNVNNGVMTIVVSLDEINFEDDGTFVLVGVKTVYKDTSRSKMLNIHWRASNLPEKLTPSAINVDIEFDTVTVLEYEILDRRSFVCKPANSKLDLEFISLKPLTADLLEVLNLCEGVISVAQLKKLKKLHVDSKQIADQLRNHTSENILNLDSDSWILISYFLANQFWKLDDAITRVEEWLSEAKRKCVEKNMFIREFQEKGIHYVNSKDNWKSMLNNNDSVCAMFYEKTFAKTTIETFFELVNRQTEDEFFCVVDLDLIPYNETFGSKPKGSVIRLYHRGNCTEEDVMNDMKKSKKSLVKGRFEKMDIMPKKRALLKLACPGHFTGGCPSTIRDWLCITCQMKLYYTFDDGLYCDLCGAAKVEDCTFRCEDYRHSNYDPLTKTMIGKLNNFDPLEEKNILIVGQSGVGKSTWINSIVNYMLFPTLDDALKYDEVIAPIPAQFILTDNNLETKTVIVGDYNTDTKTGESVTKECSTYSVLFKDCLVNLIDTPGVGDSQGVEEDRNNVEKILTFLRHVDLIHGICLLLKPNETRISVLLTYSLKEILSNLHKSASKNLLFCFTNARSTFYKPGETTPILISLLKRIGVDLDMKTRMFCLDNEAFKFLSCKDTVGISFSEEEKKDFAASWDKSVEDTTHLFEKVCSLQPHSSSDTWSLNRARRIILSLTRPIGDLTQVIQSNIDQFNIAKIDVESSKANLAQLRQYIKIPQLSLIAEPLGYPRTVCTADKCVRYHTFPNVDQRTAEYIQHCHQHCYLTGVQPDRHPNPDLLHCWAMGGQKHCTQCGCSWETHMHITYSQSPKESEEEDPKIAASINTAKNEADAKANILLQYERKKMEHEEEKAKIVNICVKFASFLSKNAIAGYNDALGDYLHFLIVAAKSRKNRSATEDCKIQRMEDLKTLYEEEKRIFELAADSRGGIVTVEDIAQYENELYQLPIYGKQIKQIMTVALAAEDNAARYKVKAANKKPQKSSAVVTSPIRVKGSTMSKFLNYLTRK